jgi:very-short-patch-repair endonuclease
MLEVSRRFRKEPQPTEALLWQSLRNRQLGLKFRRQQPIGSFVVDFYCDEAALIVEVDGPIHQYQQEADRERQQILENLDLRVLRVTADDVSTNLDRVLTRIRAALPN